MVVSAKLSIRGQQKPIYEVWVCRCDREQGRVLNGQRHLRGGGPQPRPKGTRTTPACCQCVRVPAPVQKAQREVVRRPARLLGQGFDVVPSSDGRSAERAGVSFVAQSCKDYE